MRKRGDSWELHVYAGTDPETGNRRWVSATTKGTRRAAQRELVEFAARVDYLRRMTSQATVGTLLDDWYAAISLSPHWSPTLARHNKSIIDCNLVPSLVTFSCRRLAPKTSTPSMATGAATCVFVD